MSPERRRLTLALLLSLLIHTLLLSLIFDGQGLGLPGFGFPWQDRRIEVPDLHVVLVPAPVTATEPAAAAPAAAIVAEAKPRAEAHPKSDAATASHAAKTPSRTDGPGDTAPPPIPEPAVIALARPDEAIRVVPATPAPPTPVVAAAPSASSPEIAMPPLRDAGDAAREQAIELAKLDRAMQEAQRQAQQLEAARQDIARQEAARVETARLETERQEAARQAAARQEAARQEVARQEAAQVAAAPVDVAQEAAARREATLRAIGRQLDEEAARRDASSARRGRLFGRTDPNAELILYAEAWSRKIELNMTFDMVREAAKQPHTDPLVTVAIRSDGSVESVTFVRSSGVAALDEAIERVVRSQVPYQAFSPGLAREFDVIEIRRTWYFDMAIRLY
ncbi:MAG: TonB C-terminal domain-containing protein [Betaproteobacteria bacterium]|nr:MAG: TonB C-terminal domain-containing protein [Betaproteobacteria bacterium]